MNLSAASPIKPTRSLFWRIFLSLWLGSTVLMVGSSLLIAVIADREIPDQIRERVGDLLRGNAQSLLRLYGRVSEREFAEAVAAVEHESGLAVYFVDANGRDLLGREIPAGLRDFERRLAAGDDKLTGGGPPFAGALSFGNRMRAADGREYRTLIKAVGPPLPSVELILGTMLTPLMLSVLLAGFFSAISARYLVVPIDHLRRATRQFAAGDLGSRVGAAMHERRDEFGALASDFDRMADRIGELIGAQRQLMLDLSHELRSPLARLRVALELMRNQPQSRLLDRMERDADRMDVLIGELLLLARLESPQASLPEALIELRELVSEIVDDARLEIAGQPRRIHQTSAAGEQPLQIKGDRELLHRAIENVVRNALQYSPQDADVHVALERDGRHARIRVIDRGPGFPADALTRMFTPFARGDTPDQPEGYGLGLAIARAAIQRHGGTIHVANRSDTTGADVMLRLPLDERDSS
jgi:signal transduction histidine kinase